MFLILKKNQNSTSGGFLLKKYIWQIVGAIFLFGIVTFNLANLEHSSMDSTDYSSNDSTDYSTDDSTDYSTDTETDYSSDDSSDYSTDDYSTDYSSNYSTDYSTDYSSSDYSSTSSEKSYCQGYVIGTDYNGDGVANDQDYQDKTADDIDQMARDMAEGTLVACD